MKSYCEKWACGEGPTAGSAELLAKLVQLSLMAHNFTLLHPKKDTLSYHVFHPTFETKSN